MKKVLVVNQYNSDNIGDKLLNKMLVENLTACNIDVVNLGFAQVFEQSVKYEEGRINNKKIRNLLKQICPNAIKYELKFKKKLNEVINQIDLKQFDSLIIGGGQLIKHKSVFQYCFSYWINLACKYNLDIYIYGVGIDSNLSKYEIRYYYNLIKNVKYINCRDNETFMLFQRYFKRMCDISPDIAFTYDTNSNVCKENTLVLMPYSFFTAKHSFNFDISRESYYRNLLELTNRLLIKKKLNKVILAATTSSDASECIQLFKLMKLSGYSVLLEKVMNIDQLAQLFLKSDSIITGRMHAMILGLICECDIYTIDVSDKIKTFKKEYLSNRKLISEIKKDSLIGIKNMINSVGGNRDETD